MSRSAAATSASPEPRNISPRAHWASTGLFDENCPAGSSRCREPLPGADQDRRATAWPRGAHRPDQAWLDANCGADGWAMAPAGLHGVLNDAIAIYLNDA